MIRASALCAALLLVLAGSSFSQIANSSPGLRWTGSSGVSAGDPCGNFSCVPLPVSVSSSEVVTLEIRGKYLGAWFLGFSPTATSCAAIPGAFAYLALDPPITLLFSGSFTLQDSLGECPGGLENFMVMMPPALPVGVSFSIQVLCETIDPNVVGASAWAFARPITATIL